MKICVKKVSSFMPNGVLCTYADLDLCRRVNIMKRDMIRFGNSQDMASSVVLNLS